MQNKKQSNLIGLLSATMKLKKQVEISPVIIPFKRGVASLNCSRKHESILRTLLLQDTFQCNLITTLYIFTELTMGVPCIGTNGGTL